MRVCAVDAVERIVAARRDAGASVTIADVDQTLWERGGGRR